ncbi:MAG: ATP-dependent Clp protease ATP-binding subunit [Nitrospirae bacterium]|nr:ATP-dependent Clp protease ATP-binding subunit [Nitrospirota bacterium]
MQNLTSGAQYLIMLVIQKVNDKDRAEPGINDWLLTLLERHAEMVKAKVKVIDIDQLHGRLKEQLLKGDIGALLPVDAIISRSVEHALARDKKQASEADIAAVILTAAGYEIEVADESSTKIEQIQFSLSIPTLQKFGRNLTREASEGKLSSVLGRDEEVELLIETLCRRTKRNPLLIGPAGVGKTAVVEWLAQLIDQNKVPELLSGTIIVVLQPSSLTAGAALAGELEKRVQAIIAEAAQDGIVLFIDEVHTIIGAGGASERADLASMLKPALARGEIACIGATTDDEYRRFIETDSALERRFQPIRIQELTADQTFVVLLSLRDEYQHLRGITIEDNILRWLVDFAHKYMRNRYFPDKAVDLLEQCVAHSLALRKDSVQIEDAEAAVERMVGMPTDLDIKLSLLKKSLSERSLANGAFLESLLNRLQITMRGLDLRPLRPNSVILFYAEAVRYSESVAETIAETLFGSNERIVKIDFSRFSNPADISLLLGAAPGYIGYSENLPLHRIRQIPWCVVFFENIHEAAPQVRDALKQALYDGFFIDGQGKRIYLSDTVIILTVGHSLGSNHIRGFDCKEKATDHENRKMIGDILGHDFMGAIDMIYMNPPDPDEGLKLWIEHSLLSDLLLRCREQGLNLQWDGSLVEWLFSQRDDNAAQCEWERLIDDSLSPVLIPYFHKDGTLGNNSITISYDGQRIVAQCCPLNKE